MPTARCWVPSSSASPPRSAPPSSPPTTNTSSHSSRCSLCSPSARPPSSAPVGGGLGGDVAVVGLLVVAVLVNLLVTDYRPFLNGDAGLAIVPSPLQGELNPGSTGYQWAYAAVVIAVAGGVYWFVRRITESPYGRTLRAMRDNDRGADSLGKNPLSPRTP